MAKNMRQMKKVEKKKRPILVPFLFILNMFLWWSAFYLWTQEIDAPPQTGDHFATVAEIDAPSRREPTVLDRTAALTYEDVGLHLYSSHALLINLDTGEILFDHRSGERVYPASVTKIMTVLVGIEYARSDEVIVYADFDTLFQRGSTMAGFVAGETRTLSEVLHASMLASGGDATSALAYHVADSYQGFVNLMNQTARRIGMHDTHFANATGLHDDDHYTTAYDTALLLDYALTHPYFREIFTTPTYPFLTSEGVELFWHATMFRHMPSPIFDGGEILGGKTGFTVPAGLCLASIATDGVNEFALITFAAGPSGLTPPANIRDAFAIYEYFFNLESDTDE